MTKQKLGNGITLQQQFDVYSRLTEQTWQNTANSSPHQAKQAPFSELRTYQYDKKHQLINTNQQLNAEQGQTTQQKAFSYNSLSQLLKIETSSTEENRTKVESTKANSTEASNQQSQTQHYQWDSFGNPLAPDEPLRPHAEKLATADKSLAKSTTLASSIIVKDDRLLGFSGIDYRYDGSGNQITSVAKGEKQQRSFNGLNQLKSININGALTHYQYDALGRRSAKITEQGRTDFIWDNNQLIGEHSKGEFTWYVYLPNTFEPIALIAKNNTSKTSANSVYYYHLDQLSTPVCITNEAGQQVWRNESDAFGYQSLDDKSTLDNLNENHINNPIRFQGQYFDDESQLHYNRFRYYCPKQQRFIHQDPIGLVGGINHYQYAPNPINWVDPFGLLCKEGRKRLDRMLSTLIGGAGIDESTKDKIMQSVIDSACVTVPEGELTLRNPQKKVEKNYNLKYTYDLESMKEDEGTITISRTIGDEVKEIELTIEEFAGMHEFDGKVVNEDWATKGRIKENKGKRVVKANKLINTQTGKVNQDTYVLTDKDKNENIFTEDKENKVNDENKKVSINEHCSARHDEMKERDSHPYKSQPYNNQIPKINTESANIGEKAADIAMKDKYPDFKRIHPTDLNTSESVKGTFDMVYQDEKGNIIIVEAKGGSGTLGTMDIRGVDYEQGTTEYAEATIKNMESNEKLGAATDRKAAKAINKAVNRKKNTVQYLHVQTPITKTDTGSTVSEVKISEFDINLKELAG